MSSSWSDSDYCNIINMKLIVLALRVVTRLIQGACVGNQVFFVLHTEILVSFNRIIRTVKVLTPLQSLAEPRSKEPLSSPPSSPSPPSAAAPPLVPSNSPTPTGSPVQSGRKSSVQDKGPRISFLFSQNRLKQKSIRESIYENQTTKGNQSAVLYPEALAALEEVKEAIIDVMESISESRYNQPLIFERVMATIDLSNYLMTYLLRSMLTLVTCGRCAPHSHPPDRDRVPLHEGKPFGS